MKREKLSSSEEEGGHKNDVEQDAPKRFRGNDENVRLLVPSKIAGALIGKGGQHINRLRSELKSTINVEDCQGPERTLNISGQLENALSVVEEMLKNFEEKDDEYDCRLLIHQSLAGCVIGKGGTKIREIRDKIGCRILKVFSNVCPQSSDRVVQIVGKSSECVAAIREIMQLVKEVPIKGPVMNYDPINYDDIFSEKYGGYGDGAGARQTSSSTYRESSSGSRFDRRGNVDRGGSGGYSRRGDGEDSGRSRERRDPISSGRGHSGSRLRDSSREFIDPWAPNSGPVGGAYSSGSSSTRGGAPGADGSFGLAPGEEKNSTQVTIPKDLAGAIIGKAGSRIRRIRMESNAFITIDEPLPGSADRIITITGSQKQIQMAQYLLQQSVHEHRKC